MIRRILTHYTSLLDEYLSRLYHQPEGMAETGFIGNGADEKPCKMVVSLLSIEKETTGGIRAGVQRTAGEFVRRTPPLLLNLDLVLAAVYDEKQYAKSLSVLSDTLTFIQSTPVFGLGGATYTVEIAATSPQDRNNIWTLLGGQYHPSVVCKLRRLVIDGGEITSGGSVADKPVVRM